MNVRSRPRKIQYVCKKWHMLVTHTAPIKPSLELLETRCLALHILIRAKAPTASLNVHNMEEVTRDVGNNVENSDRNRGDWWKTVIGQ
jgi:hypothetical protein